MVQSFDFVSVRMAAPSVRVTFVYTPAYEIKYVGNVHSSTVQVSGVESRAQCAMHNSMHSECRDEDDTI